MMRERVIHLWALICVLACLYLSSASNNSPANEGFCNSSIKSLHSDCTFMLGPGNDLCTIHHTNSCKTYDFGTWNMSPPHKIYALDDLDYEVFLKTYSYKYNHASALTLNISFSTSLRDVHGFGFTLVEYSFPDERKRYNTCRIFDFRKFSLKEHASVFYDCYYNIGGDNKNSFFLLTTRSLPANHLAEFFVTLSTSPVKQGGETLCNWESTVLILKPALAISSVELMFSVAKADLQVEHYSVSLVKHISSDSWQYAEQIVSVNPSVNSSKKFVVQKLGNVQPGKYHIEIHPVHPDWSGDLCSITKTDAFVLPAGEGRATTGIIVACIACTALLAGAVLYIWHRRKQVSARHTARVILLYSYDSTDHYQMIRTFYEFLCAIPGLEVVFDAAQANDMGVPHIWLLRNLRSVDHIILVISNGVYKKVERDFRPCHEHHPWGDHVVPAVLDIIRDRPLHDKLVKVIFADTTESRVPTSLVSKGKTFKLPNELDYFVHHLFGERCHSQLQCTAKHAAWYSSDKEKSLQKAIRKYLNRCLNVA